MSSTWCEAEPAPAGRGEPGPVSRDARPSLEDGLLSVWLGPFAWLGLIPLAGSVLLFWTGYRLQHSLPV